MNRSIATALCVVTLCALSTGCNQSASPFKSVPVSGKVVYEDGSAIPVGGMKLYFHCLEPPKDGKHPRTAAVGVGADGTFKDVTTYKYADGLVLGKHKVAVVCGEGDRLIPKECTIPTETPIVIEVTESRQVLEIKVPKPKEV